MKRYISILLLALLVVSCAPQAGGGTQGFGKLPDETPPTQPEKPLVMVEEPVFTVQGHRGARAIYPENTLPAFQYALNLPVDEMEFDIHYTKDDDLVIFHDDYISDRTCKNKDGSKIGKKIAIRTLSLEQVKQFDCGSSVHNKMPQNLVPGSEIPTFDEVLDLVTSTPGAEKVLLKIDIKSDAKHPELFPSPIEIARLVLVHVYDHKVQNRAVYSAFDERVLEYLKSLDPTARTYYLLDSFLTKKTLQRALDLGVLGVSPHYLLLSLQGAAKWTKRAHDVGLKMVPYTVDKEKQWKKLIEAGVDGIITDDPEGLRKFYDSHVRSGGKVEPTQEDLMNEVGFDPIAI